jgi:hypothetical protein
MALQLCTNRSALAHKGSHRFSPRIRPLMARSGRRPCECRCLLMTQKRPFPSPQVSGYTNIIPPARKDEEGMEMGKRRGGSTVSSLICGEI